MTTRCIITLLFGYWALAIYANAFVTVEKWSANQVPCIVITCMGVIAKWGSDQYGRKTFAAL